jgi:hypothetical protein
MPSTTVLPSRFSRFGTSRLTRLSGIAIAVVLTVLAFYNLSNYPTPWFDEGVHMHVPQTLVRYGVYADRSSDGFRYFGPTLGVGPTVMLPIAAVYRVFGIGLTQARVVMALYLLLALYLAYRLAKTLDGGWFAAAALALLVTSPALAFLETGRQVLGEVPGFAFLVGGLLVWFADWRGSRLASTSLSGWLSANTGSWTKLTLAGLLFGAAAVTKYQNLIALAPMIVMAAAADLLYYRRLGLKVFLWPALVLGGLFGAWQLILIVYLGPQTAAENFAALREATAGAAAAFSRDAMVRAVRELTSFRAYGATLPLALAYGLLCARPRTEAGQRWAAIFLLAAINIAWYVLASIGWPRYAFTGLAFASFLLGKFFIDLFLNLAAAARNTAGRDQWITSRSLQGAVAAWLLLIVGASAAATIRPIVAPPENHPAAISAYLNRAIPETAVVETWEQELGALTPHNYHYPPSRLLNVAVRHIWLGGPPPAEVYQPLTSDRPPYVVVGAFAKWVALYPPDVLEREYTRDAVVGPYEVYRRSDVVADRPQTARGF